jgi:nucleoside-diphosphate-sugar epimerase
MKIVVTGALGHIGSRFIHAMRPGEYSRVLLLDNLATRRRNSLFGLPGGVPFRFIEEDVLSADLPRLLDGFDAVVHLAAIADAGTSYAKPDEVERVNYEGTLRVAEACRVTGAGLFFPSTASVYAPHAGIAREDGPDADIAPQTPYAAGKRRAEILLREMNERGLRHTVGRLGTIFGASPGMRFHTAVNRFVWQACMGQPVTVWRTAMEQRRPYLDVLDAAAAISFLTRRKLFDGAIRNITTSGATVSDVLGILRRRVPDLDTRLVESPAMNALTYDAPSERLLREGFVFTGSLERGIGETVDLLRHARAAGAEDGAGA